jgi:hypothetical protein
VWTRFVLVVSVVLSSLAGAGAGARVGAIEPGAPITVTPDEGAPFTVVTVTGADCTDGPSPFVSGIVRGSPDVGVISDFFATPDDAGAWTAEFIVPPNRAAVTYEVVATCKPDRNAFEGVEYGIQPFTILEGEEATMTVSPLRARAGTDIMVTASGTLCRGPDATVELRAFVRFTEDADEFVAQTTVTPAADGTWTGQFTIPNALAVTYGVTGHCLFGDISFILYPVADIVVSPTEAPPARPLPARPTFTG